MDNLENNAGLPETEQTEETSVLQPENELDMETLDFDPDEKDDPEAVRKFFEALGEYTEREERKEKKERRKKIWRMIFPCILTLIVVACATTISFTLMQRHWGDEVKRNEQIIHQMQQTIDQLREEIKDNSFTGNGNSVSGTPNTNPEGLTPGQVYAKCEKGVVAVTAKTIGPMTQATSSGTGFLVTEDGYVVTNCHVVQDATSVVVTVYGGQEYRAEVIGSDEANDVAVLKIEAQGLQALQVGNSDELIVGDQVVAIGFPLGTQTSTLTVGYVSAKDRVISTDGARINMIQSDVAINSGNSGGPLLNMKGEVVGITTAKFSGTSGSGASIEGTSFAVPMNDVWKKITDLRDYGYITGGALGVMVQDVDQETAEYYGLPLGAYVSEVNQGSGAEKAGVAPRDIIVAIGDDQVTSLNELSRVLEQYSGGETTTITVWRGGRELVLNITLDARTPDF